MNRQHGLRAGPCAYKSDESNRCELVTQPVGTRLKLLPRGCTEFDECSIGCGVSPYAGYEHAAGGRDVGGGPQRHHSAFQAELDVPAEGPAGKAPPHPSPWQSFDRTLFGRYVLWCRNSHGEPGTGSSTWWTGTGTRPGTQRCSHGHDSVPLPGPAPPVSLPDCRPRPSTGTR